VLGINFAGSLDKRLERRCNQLASSLFKNFTNSIQHISSSRAEQIGGYRFLNNERVEEGLLIEEQASRCAISSQDKVVLCIHDTSEANFFHHSNRLKPDSGLGKIDAAKKGIGFKMHLSFVLDAKSYYPYGISHLKFWYRDEQASKTPYSESRKQPISEKESYKWLEGCANSNKVLEKAAALIHVQDREGDIYEQIADFDKMPNTFYIIRSKTERRIEDNQRLWEQLSSSPVLGKYELLLCKDNHRQANRKATLEVRQFKGKVKCPEKKSTGLPEYSNEITVIEAREVNTPIGEQPVLWRLLTNCHIQNIEDALQVIDWYTARWFIEELFRLIKKENFDIEGCELESGWALRKWTSMAIDVGIKLFQFYIARELEEGLTLDMISSFSADEFECLTLLCKNLEGNTEKQKNPFKPQSVQWVIWIMARLGGWKGYASQRKPGMTTILQGIKKFYQVYEGWSIKKDVCTR
jgi:hypothetical protein